jgi:hypothetical protein
VTVKRNQLLSDIEGQGQFLLCPHCGRRKSNRLRRRLCWTCSLDPAIRDLYPISRQAPRPLSPAERAARNEAIERRYREVLSTNVVGPEFGMTGEAVRVILRNRAGGPKAIRRQVREAR